MLRPAFGNKGRRRVSLAAERQSDREEQHVSHVPRRARRCRKRALSLVIRDRASIHDFHLTGPGLDRMLTTVGFTGTKSFVLKLKKGAYRDFCDPHSAEMHGGFRVV